MQTRKSSTLITFMRWLLAMTLAAASHVGWTQPRYPSKPIQVISTATPGSQSDTLLRYLGEQAAKTLGQPVVVVSSASAAGTIGADQARRAPPDGYTLFMGGNTTMAANVHLVKNLTYDPLRDFEPITLVSANPLVLVVRADLPIKTVPEFIAYAKARPGKLNYGVGNSGNKVAVGLLQSITGISATEIPFKGASQAMLELVAGRVDFIISDPLVADQFIKQGAIRALAVTAPVPLPSMRSLPTIADAGVPGYQEITTFLALYAPRGTPQPVIDVLNSAFVKAIASKEGHDQFERLGLAPRTSTPQALAAFTKDQIKAWAHLVKVSGLQPE
ncbi:Bug family tripartite tricarboxylate transporter substrate binding protein [Azohydromonas australica]|uniref:Bug family tripartite tricarboxylate transporter substrate binding protein n=1 Tax=Azohydromonas australica TaxID=364039 RepID=UPI00040469E9|nr:tripartite tricarboxylate transporter substrate binding protein [Azohydromonas australica]